MGWLERLGWPAVPWPTTPIDAEPWRSDAYTTTAVLSSLIGAATTVWQVGVLRAGASAARGLRVPARNALPADIVPATVYGRAHGFERAMDNLGAIAGPLFALVLVGLAGTRTAIALSIIPGLLAALATFPSPRSRRRVAPSCRPTSRRCAGSCSRASACPASSRLTAATGVSHGGRKPRGFPDTGRCPCS